MKKCMAGDFLMIGEIIIIGLAEAAHLAAVILGWTFTECALFLAGLACAVVFLGGLFVLLRFKGVFGKRAEEGQASAEKRETIAEGKDLFLQRGSEFLHSVAGRYCVVFLLLFLSQLIFLCRGDANYRVGDMTVETVGSFLEEDGLYQVNPMTGAAYTGGIPFRLEILCLPTLYASLSKLTGLSPAFVVWKIIPIFTLISCYTAFGLLAGALFPEEKGSVFREKRVCFLAIVSLLMWVGAYQAGIDGFQLLCGGWRGVTIRNLVFLPWLLSLCLRRKWLTAVLCIPAEACIVWTLYGCGVCLPVLLGMAGSQLCCKGFAYKKKREGRTECS